MGKQSLQLDLGSLGHMAATAALFGAFICYSNHVNREYEEEKNLRFAQACAEADVTGEPVYQHYWSIPVGEPLYVPEVRVAYSSEVSASIMTPDQSAYIKRLNAAGTNNVDLGPCPF